MGNCCSFSILSSKPELKSDWAGLHEDLVDLILDKLAINLADYYRFGVICKAWNSCMLNHYTKKRITLTTHHLPWLLLCRRISPDDVKGLCLYNFSTGKICEPKLDINPFRKFGCKTFRGSSYGWMFFMENSVLTLSNPLSGAFFHLPELDTSRSETPFSTVTLSSDPSLGSFEVLVSSFDDLLGHYKSGDESWTYLENWKSNCCGFESFIFTKDHILAVYADHEEENLYLHIISRDFDPSKGSIKEIPTAPELYDENTIVYTYFVETTSGDLLMVLRHCEYDGDFDFETFKGYKIYELIGLGLEEQVELVPIENLGGDCLFLGDFNHNISVLASNYPGFMPNTIYCASNNDEGKIEVFNLMDGIVASVCLPQQYFHIGGTNLMVPSIKL